MVEILAMATEISAVTSGLIQAVKQTNLIKKEYLPLTLPHLSKSLSSIFSDTMPMKSP